MSTPRIAVRIPADQYEDYDDCLGAAADDWVYRYGVSRNQMGVSWLDDDREWIVIASPVVGGLMTEKDAIEILREAAEDDTSLDSSATELFIAVFGRTPDVADGDAGTLISHCYAALPEEVES